MNRVLANFNPFPPVSLYLSDYLLRVESAIKEIEYIILV
jgi:hypothetical protein